MQEAEEPLIDTWVETMVTAPSTSVRKWGDDWQYLAAPMQANVDSDGNILPSVKLLSMNADPLGSIAALARMYEGKPTYSLSDITDDERKRYFEQVQKTHLQTPFEAVNFHFFLEGVTRSFTHQMVRIRTGSFSQESMRFAVTEDMAARISKPPSIAGLKPSDDRRSFWDQAIKKVDEAYNYLVANGIPAEDARGLMPHATTTRLNFCIDLKNLSGHAGNRLCTQAQFEWRIVFMEMVKAIREYTPDFSWLPDQLALNRAKAQDQWEAYHRWQFEMLADSGIFRPICYQLGRCQFNADFDRSCTIRSRVDALANDGIPSSEWSQEFQGDVAGIDPAEWLLDAGAARKGGGGHE